MKAAKNYPPKTLSVNAIFSVGGTSRFVTAGTPLDAETLIAMPPSIRKYLIRAEPESDDQDSEPAVANFQLGTVYNVDENNRLRRRHLERQATAQASVAQFQDEMEQRLAYELAHPDEATKTALEVAADRRQAEVDLEIAQRQYKAKQIEMDEEAAKQFIAEQDQMLIDENPVSPTIIPESPAAPDWTPQPKRMRKRYVCRNGTWLRTKNLKRFRPGEKVFVRNGPNDFQQIGVVKNGRLPAAYLED